MGWGKRRRGLPIPGRLQDFVLEPSTALLLCCLTVAFSVHMQGYGQREGGSEGESERGRGSEKGEERGIERAQNSELYYTRIKILGSCLFLNLTLLIYMPVGDT